MKTHRCVLAGLHSSPSQLFDVCNFIRHAQVTDEKAAGWCGGPKVQIQNREKITMFIGQMPYDTKVDDIVPWLKAIMQRHGCAHDIGAVRLAGSGNSNKKSLKGLLLSTLRHAKRRTSSRSSMGPYFMAISVG